MIVTDSLGIGEAPDAEAFGDVGANTLKSLHESGSLNIPNLISLGLGSIDGIDFLKKTDAPRAAVARMRELSLGKDTTIGHWEIAGVISEHPMPTYPDGFPEEIIAAFEGAIGRGSLCNLPYSGTDVIRDYGEEHIRTGKPIVYTSADSVFQIAAHEDVIPTEELYEICRRARNILTGEHSVGRVIARPFVTGDDGFVRTANRRDFSVEPPKPTMLDAISKSGLDVISVGKISDIFATRGITESYISHGNDEGLDITKSLLDKDFTGLAFINLVDFDSMYGHRQDAKGYAEALSRFDSWLPSFISGLGDEDVLIITADHGCDPSDDSTDHTREYVPLIACGNKIRPENLGTLTSFASIARFVTGLLNVDFTADGGDDILGELL